MEAQRLSKVREVIEQQEIDALLISSPFNRRYVTGFTGTAGWAVITQDQAWLVTDFRYVSQAGQQAKAFEVVQHGGQPLELIREKLSAAGVKKMGFEKHHVPFADYETYERTFAGIELTPIGDVIEKLRGIKDEGSSTVFGKQSKLRKRPLRLFWV